VAEHRGGRHHPHHDLLFDTWSYVTGAPMRLAKLREVLSGMPSTVFRVKGFVHAAEEPRSRLVLQLVGRRATITPTRWPDGAIPRTRIVLIARHDTVNFDAIGKELDQCHACNA